MLTGETGKPWTVDEVDATVAKYFDMFVLDLQGHLYRLYGFGSKTGTGLYRLQGNLEEACRLDAVSFEAVPRRRPPITVM
ncbi:hypothetical protein ACVWYS_002841 [Arthrobacter sp. TE12231]